MPTLRRCRLLLSLFSLFFAGCSGPTGPKGQQGDTGSSPTVTVEAPGNNCPNGGYRIDDGSTVFYACNGTDGSSGASATVSDEPPGDNCAYGGVRIDDATGTRYLCNGLNGDACLDADGDGYGVGDGCAGADCNDTLAAINPAAIEIPYNGVDEDCDGIDSWDADGDGYTAVDAPYGSRDDCDDTAFGSNPDATELTGNNVDEDCDGVALDVDGDGALAIADGGDDCDDGDATVHVGAIDISGDVIDQDCSGDAYDQDGDGDDDVLGGDCDDTDATRSSLLVEIAGDGIDNDCNAATRDDDFDRDGDGYTAVLPVGDAQDCDDTNPAVHPGAAELPDDGIDNDCDGVQLTTDDTSGIFVAPPPFGDDSNDGSSAAPVATLGNGIALAASAGKVLFVAVGTYDELIDATVAIYGGYSDDGSWARAASGEETLVQAPVSPPAAATLQTIAVSSPNDVTLANLHVIGPTYASHTTGVFVAADARALIDACEVDGGNASGANNEANGLWLEGSAEITNSVIFGGTASAGWSTGVRGVGASAKVHLQRTWVDGGRSTNVRAVLSDNLATVQVDDSEIFSGVGSVTYAFALQATSGGHLWASRNHITTSTAPLVAAVYGIGASDVHMRGNFFHGGIATAGTAWGMVCDSSTTLTSVGDRLDAPETQGASANSEGAYVGSGCTASFVNSVIRAGKSVSGNAYGLVSGTASKSLVVANSYVASGSAAGTSWGLSLASLSTVVNSVVDAGHGATESIAVEIAPYLSGPYALLNNDLQGAWLTAVVRVRTAFSTYSDLTVSQLNSCAFVGCRAAGDNFSAAPLFAYADSAPGLLAQSPLRDSGVDASTIAWDELGVLDVRDDAGVDYYGNPRQGGAWDIGPAEYVDAPEPEDADLDGASPPADCDDHDPLVGPHMRELYDDGRDNDCAGDGDATASDAVGVFVSDSLGDDGNAGTMASPLKTIATAVVLAEAQHKSVFVMQGDYIGSVTSNVPLFGGYDGTWQRDPVANVSVIHPSPGSHTVSLGGDALLDGFTVTGDSAGTTTLVTVVVLAGGKVQVSRNVLIAPTVSSGNSHALWAGGDLVAVANDISGGSAPASLLSSFWLDGTWGGRSVLIANTISAGTGSTSHAVGTIYDGTAILLGNSLHGASQGSGSRVVSIVGGVARLRGNTVVADYAPGNMAVYSAGRTTLEGDDLVCLHAAGGNGCVVNDGALVVRDTSVQASVAIINRDELSVVGSSLDAYQQGVQQPSGGGVAIVACTVRTEIAAALFASGGRAEAVGNDTKGYRGLNAGGASATFINNRIRATNLGIANFGSGLIAINNAVFSDDIGMFESTGSVVLLNNFISGQNAAVDFQQPSPSDTLVLRNNVLWGPTQSWAMSRKYSPSPGVTNSESSNDPGIINSCDDTAWLGCAGSGGNMLLDPRFVDWPNDLHLREDSFLHDAGIDPRPWYDSPYVHHDAEGRWRPSDGDGDGFARWDVGLYEGAEFETAPRSCAAVLAGNASAGDGFYLIDPDGMGGRAPFYAACDMRTDGGGWTLAMRYPAGSAAAAAGRWSPEPRGVERTSMDPDALFELDDEVTWLLLTDGGGYRVDAAATRCLSGACAIAHTLYFAPTCRVHSWSTSDACAQPFLDAGLSQPALASEPSARCSQHWGLVASDCGVATGLVSHHQPGGGFSVCVGALDSGDHACDGRGAEQASIAVWVR